jgi:hypothetical protein
MLLPALLPLLAAIVLNVATIYMIAMTLSVVVLLLGFGRRTVRLVLALAVGVLAVLYLLDVRI